MPDLKNIHNWSHEDWAEAMTALTHEIEPMLRERVETNEVLEKHKVFPTILVRESGWREVTINLNLPDESIFDADRLVSIKIYRGQEARYMRSYNGPALKIEGTWTMRSLYQPRHFKTRKDGTINLEAALDYAIEIAEATVRRAIGRYESEQAHQNWLANLRRKTPLPWDGDGNLRIESGKHGLTDINIEPDAKWEKTGFRVDIRGLRVGDINELLDLLDAVNAQIPLVGPDPRDHHG